MVDWLDWIVKLGTLVASVVAAIAAFLALRLVGVGKDQVQQTLEARHDQVRPLLVPDGARFILFIGQSKDLEGHEYPFANLNHPHYNVALENFGAGPALGVRGVIYGAPPVSGSHETHHYFKFVAPILTKFRGGTADERQPEERREEESSEPGVIILPGSATIDREGRYTLFAPPLPSLGESLIGAVPVIVARRTVTYTDTFGRKHASIFDYGLNQEWRAVDGGFFPDIPKTIEELDREVRAEREAAQSAHRGQLAQSPITLDSQAGEG